MWLLLDADRLRRLAGQSATANFGVNRQTSGTTRGICVKVVYFMLVTHHRVSAHMSTLSPHSFIVKCHKKGRTIQGRIAICSHHQMEVWLLWLLCLEKFIPRIGVPAGHKIRKFVEIWPQFRPCTVLRSDVEKLVTTWPDWYHTVARAQPCGIA